MSLITQRRIANQSNKKFQFLTNFHMREYDRYLEVIKRTNQKLNNPNALSVSKIAYANGEQLEDCGSIWYSCSIEDLQTYHKLNNVSNEEEKHNIKRITKKEIESLPVGLRYYMMYVNNRFNRVDVTACIKIASSNNNHISWNEEGDTEFDECVQFITMINEDGSFNPSHSFYDETGYLYIGKLDPVSIA